MLVLRFKERWNEHDERSVKCLVHLILSSSPRPAPLFGTNPVRREMRFSGMRDPIDRIHRAFGLLLEHVQSDRELKRPRSWEFDQLAEFHRPSIAVADDDHETRRQRFAETLAWARGHYGPHIPKGKLETFMGAMLLKVESINFND